MFAETISELLRPQEIMKRKLFLFWRALSHSAYSPVDFVAVCIGFWLPLGLMLSSNTLTAIPSMLLALRVIAFAVVWNTILALVCAAAVLAGCAVLAMATRISFQKIAPIALAFLTGLAILAAIRDILSSYLEFSNMAWAYALQWGVLLIASCVLVRVRFQVRSWIFLPKAITCLLLLFSTPLVIQEYWQTLRHEQNSSRASGNVAQMHHPDIVLITFDALSARHLHLYGYQRPTSPHLEAFASEAIVFDNFYANANWTRPGIASILNGLRPWMHQGDISIPSDSVTERRNLLLLLRQAGYSLNIVQSNNHADFSAQGVQPDARKVFLWSNRSLLKWLPSGRLASAQLMGRFGLAGKICNFEIRFGAYPTGKSLPYLPSAEEMLQRSSSSRPMFLWMHILVPHDPYAAVEPFIGTFDPSSDARTFNTSLALAGFHKRDMPRTRLLQARYDEAVLMSDDLFGKIVQMLKRNGRYDNSLIVVAADHGESFNPVCGGHGGELLTEEVLRVPGLLKPPTAFSPLREPRLMEQVDLLPTILSYAGLPLPAGGEGYAYPEKPGNLPVYAINRNLKNSEKSLNVAMRDGDWKYVAHIGRMSSWWPGEELYNLAADPNENSNLIAAQTERAVRMRRRLEDELRKHGLAVQERQP